LDKSRTRRDEQKRKYCKMVKGQRISWLGHLQRMEEDRMPRKIFTQELEGMRRRVRRRRRRRAGRRRRIRAGRR